MVVDWPFARQCEMKQEKTKRLISKAEKNRWNSTPEGEYIPWIIAEALEERRDGKQGKLVEP